MLTDPVALGAALRLGDGEAADAVTLSRLLLDYSNAVIGLGRGERGRPAAARRTVALTDGRRVPLRDRVRRSCPAGPRAPSARWHRGRETPVDDLFALDLARVADTATARRGSTGRTVLVASLHRAAAGLDHVALLGELLGRPVHCLISEPAAARLGARTTPGARADAVVVDLGAGTIDVIAPDGEVVAAGAGDLLTAAVAETLNLPRAAADWVKRGPCLRITGSQQFEAEDGSHGFLDRPAAATTLGHAGRPRPGRAAAVRPAAQPGRVAGPPAPAQGGGVRGQPAPRGPAAAPGRASPPGAHRRRPGRRRRAARRAAPGAARRGHGRPGQRRRHAARRTGRPPARGRARPGPGRWPAGWAARTARGGGSCAARWPGTPRRNRAPPGR